MHASKIKMHVEGMPATGAGIHGERKKINKNKDSTNNYSSLKFVEIG